MCWEIDYNFFAEQEKKAQEARIQEERRTGVVKDLLDQANKQPDDTPAEKAPVNEVVPAK